MFESFIKIPIDDFYLDGDISLPVRAQSLVIFSHGSGNNRFSPRNKMIARELRKAGYGTLLFDFMGEHETEDYGKRFEVDTLSERLVSVTNWISTHDDYTDYDIGFVGAGLGSAMALNAAAALPGKIKAVACRGAQTELVNKANIPKIESPTLLIAGEDDPYTVEQNQKLIEKLTCPKKLVTISGAGRLMEKPKTMQRVAKETIGWFNHYLRRHKLDPVLEYDAPDIEY